MHALRCTQRQNTHRQPNVPAPALEIYSRHKALKKWSLTQRFEHQRASEAQEPPWALHWRQDCVIYFSPPATTQYAKTEWVAGAGRTTTRLRSCWDMPVRPCPSTMQDLPSFPVFTISIPVLLCRLTAEQRYSVENSRCCWKACAQSVGAPGALTRSRANWTSRCCGPGSFPRGMMNDDATRPGNRPPIP